MSSHYEENIKVLQLPDVHTFETLLKVTALPAGVEDEVMEIMRFCNPPDFKRFIQQELPPTIASYIKQIVADI